jgi:hypothetical protein
MRKIYSAESIVEISHLRNILESTGIRCLVRNDRLSGAVGEIPFVECWPELWLLDERDALRAKGVLDAEFARQARPGKNWTCETCGETIEGQFAECWRCAARTLEDS